MVSEILLLLNLCHFILALLNVFALCKEGSWRSSLAVQQVKDLVFHPWPGNFRVAVAWPKNKNKKQGATESARSVLVFVGSSDFIIEFVFRQDPLRTLWGSVYLGIRSGPVSRISSKGSCFPAETVSPVTG